MNIYNPEKECETEFRYQRYIHDIIFMGTAGSGVADTWIHKVHSTYVHSTPQLISIATWQLLSKKSNATQ